ncbi:MAG: hypothetical protein WCF57_03790 [Pyrinomonadaceae bacterium]
MISLASGIRRPSYNGAPATQASGAFRMGKLMMRVLGLSFCSFRLSGGQPE